MAPLSGGFGNHFAVQFLVTVPVAAFVDICHGKFPVLLLVEDSFGQAVALFILRYVQENLEDWEAVFIQVRFPVADLTVAYIPDILADEVLRHLALLDQIMDAGNDDVFIVGTVEYADIPAAWKGFVNAPHVIVVLFLFGRLLEGNDVDPVRIEMREYVLDCAVLLAASIACRTMMSP